jgi:hypothetical protein
MCLYSCFSCMKKVLTPSCIKRDWATFLISILCVSLKKNLSSRIFLQFLVEGGGGLPPIPCFTFLNLFFTSCHCFVSAWHWAVGCWFSSLLEALYETKRWRWFSLICLRIWSLWVSIYYWVDLDKVSGLVFMPFFEARSMISRHSMHLTHPS